MFLWRVIGELVERKFIDVLALETTNSKGVENDIRAFTFHKKCCLISYVYSTQLFNRFSRKVCPGPVRQPSPLHSRSTSWAGASRPTASTGTTSGPASTRTSALPRRTGRRTLGGWRRLADDPFSGICCRKMEVFLEGEVE